MSTILRKSGWMRDGATSACGQAYDRDGTLLRAKQLAAIFEAAASDEGWRAIAARLNGCFAAARVAPDGSARAVVDRVRSIPLFYAGRGAELIVSDAADDLRAESLTNTAIDAFAASEFRQTGYVTGAGTLCQDIEQIRAGHCLFRAAGSGTCVQVAHHTFRHGAFFTDDDATLIDRLAATHERVFRRLVADVGTRPIVVPLSGGYDSRLVGVMLRDLGCRDVLCYTYGAEGNWESRISRELASYLGFRWTMVTYSASAWRAWAATPQFQRYFHTAGNLCAVPHIQDWPAVYELAKRGELAPDAVFVPGHSGDFLAGSHIPKWYPSRTRLARDDILQSIFDTHFTLWDWPAGERARLSAQFAARIDDVAGPIVDGTSEYAADVFECWDLQERQAKFIVNSVRVYEALGYEWRLPLFDAELMDFWARVPLEERVGRRLYFRFVEARQRLPVTAANTDRAPAAAAAVAAVSRLGLLPLAKRIRREIRRLRYRQCYEQSDLAWFALVDRDEFRRRFTGREIGHSFFALQYLDALKA